MERAKPKESTLSLMNSLRNSAHVSQAGPQANSRSLTASRRQRSACGLSAPRAIASPKKKPRPVHAVWIDEWSASAVLWRHPHRQQQARAPSSLAVLRRRSCSCNWSRVHSRSPSPSCRSHHQRRRSCRGHSSHQQLLAPHASKPLRPSVDLKPPRKAAGVMALSEAAIAGTASLLRRRHCRLRRPRRPA